MQTCPAPCMWLVMNTDVFPQKGGITLKKTSSRLEHMLLYNLDILFNIDGTFPDCEIPEARMHLHPIIDAGFLSEH